MDDRTYLGTGLSPEAYYARHAGRYENPHAEGVEALLALVEPGLPGGVVCDLGCGEGVVTRWLLAHAPGRFSPYGVDAFPEMVKRYEAETGRPGRVARFTEPLGEADVVIASYSLHLAEPSRLAEVWWRLAETGASRVVVIGPFKAKPPDPTLCFEPAGRHEGPYGPFGKRLYARIFDRIGG